MNISIINVGNEVIEGDVLNSNAQFLSERLFEIGHKVLFHCVCRDDEEEILSVINFYSKKSDMVILTGGLGPTQDDMTKEVLAKYLNISLVPNNKVLDDIKEKFKFYNKEMTENNIKQSYVIEGAKILFNEKGTAPGFLIERNECSYILLPGPPRELKYLFDKYIIDFFIKKIGKNKLKSEIIKIANVGESTVETRIKDLIDKENIYVATYAKLGEVKVKISTLENHGKILKVKNEIIKRFKDNIVGFNEKENSQALCEYLIKEGLSISTAESCTGGLIAYNIVKNSGVSSIFSGSFVTYSNEMKMKILNVKKETLDNYGAVSPEVAKEMLIGLEKRTNSDILVAVTGIAGPNGGSDEKPVGLVYIGVKILDDICILENKFRGNRLEIQERTSRTVFDIIYKKLVIDKLL